MRTDSLFQRYELFVTSGIIAAQANYPSEGFRQRDVRFIIELFSNWVEFSLSDATLALSNTQIARYLDTLVIEGSAKKTKRGKHPQYRLTRIGLIELLSRLAKSAKPLEPSQFLFVYYFIYNYKSRILEMIKTEGTLFPLGMRLEVESLLDTTTLLAEERKRVETKLKKLHARIADSNQSSRLARDLYRRGLTSQEVAKHLEQSYPYGMNSKKPLTELFNEIPTDIGKWELETGAIQRCSQLWTPARVLLNTYLQQLNKL